MQVWKILPLIILLAGCVPLTAPSPALLPAQLTASSPTPTPLPQIFSNFTYDLTLYLPANYTVVSQPQLIINGELTTHVDNAEVVMRINDQNYLLNPGIFTITVALEEGANTLYFIIRDLNNYPGSINNFYLTIYYQP